MWKFSRFWHCRCVLVAQTPLSTCAAVNVFGLALFQVNFCVAMPCCAVLCCPRTGVGLFLGLSANMLLWGTLVVPFVAVGLVSRFWPLVRSTFVSWKERLQQRWKERTSGPGTHTGFRVVVGVLATPFSKSQVGA